MSKNLRLIAPFVVFCGFLPGQTLNMSHDLTTLGIATQNLTPNNPSLDARPLFQAAIQYIGQNRVQTLTLDPGNYYFLTAQQQNPSVDFPPATLIFSGLSNLTVDLAGSTFYFNVSGWLNGFFISNCSNFTLTNLQTEWITAPYTHVQLTAIDTVNQVLKYQTLPGWPDPSSFPDLGPNVGEGFAAVVFRNGAVVPGTARLFLANAPAANTLTLQQGGSLQGPVLSALQPGDTAVVLASLLGPRIYGYNSDSVVISNVTIYVGNGVGVGLSGVSNSTIDNVRIMPRPVTGLIGSIGTGIQFDSVRQNDHILNCYVSRSTDDAVVMESLNVATVVSQDSSRQLTVTPNPVLFPVGTLVNFVDPVTTAEVPGATIVSEANSPNSNGQMVVTFDSDLPTLPPGAGMVFGTPAMRGQGSTIEDNIVEDTYGGRGIWISGAQGIIAERNVVRRTSNAAIEVDEQTSPADFPGGPVHDITLQDNSLESDLGPQSFGYDTGIFVALASINVIAGSNSAPFAPVASNTDVSILNNYIADSGRSGISAEDVDGGSVQNNVIIRYSQAPALGGWFPLTPQSQYFAEVMQNAAMPLVVGRSSSVTETANTASATSPIVAPVSMTPPGITLASAAAVGSFAVETVVTGFGWKAVSDSSWLTITSSASGTGAGTVQYAVAANSSGAAQTGHITIAGEVFTVVQMNEATLDTAILSIAVTHTGNFTQGQNGAVYVVTVSNQASAMSAAGTVTVAEMLPTGLTLASMAGPGWTCSNGSCTRSDALAGGASYPPVIVNVNVAPNAAGQVINQVTVSGGGAAAASASDLTTVGLAGLGPPPPKLTSVSAAAGVLALAPGSLATAYGADLATSLATAQTTPLPFFLNGTSVSIQDASGATTAAPLIFVAPLQVNYLIPRSVATGMATITASSGDGTQSVGQVNIASVAPALFTQNTANLVAADAVCVLATGAQTLENVYQLVNGAVVAAPLNLGACTKTVLEIYGTGLDSVSATEVQVTMGTTEAVVDFAGPQGSFVGLDQINVEIPSSLAGSGNIPILLTAGGQQANTVNVTIQ